MRWEVEHDGRLVQAEPELSNDIDGLLKAALSQFSWQITSYEKDGSLRKITLSHHKEGVKILNIFLGAIRKEEDRRSNKEKRIQLGNRDPRITKALNSSEVTTIIGIYVKNANDTLENAIFASWEILDTFNYSTNPSLRLNVETLQKAKIFGFAQTKNEANTLITAFEPSFLHYFLSSQVKQDTPKDLKNTNNLIKQKILFGAPGTGKSHKINALRKEFGAKEFKTVFHPDSDYSTFVGAYKPMMQGDKVRYAFVPQVFTKAYTHAWNNPEELVLLTIEEINRGNCAQIFGDLFQCLDRNASGASEYAIDAEYDLTEYLKETLDNQAIMNSVFQENYQAENAYSKIALPPNLLIYATMNTSDQSLFPMDSAFKRRWDWEYVPINYEEAMKMTIQLDETTAYNWGDFITKINEKIYVITQGEDKQLGNYFVKTSNKEAISLDVFRSKVMFYLWSEIFKEENESDTIFKFSENGEYKSFTFNQLYNDNVVEVLKSFMAFNNVNPS